MSRYVTKQGVTIVHILCIWPNNVSNRRWRMQDGWLNIRVRHSWRKVTRKVLINTFKMFRTVQMLHLRECLVNTTNWEPKTNTEAVAIILQLGTIRVRSLKPVSDLFMYTKLQTIERTGKFDAFGFILLKGQCREFFRHSTL